MAVTRAGFGGIPIQRVDDETATRVIRRALDLGIDWFDTAHGYGPSEERIGRAIRGYDRDRLRLFTKSPAKTAEDLRAHLELSLRRLGVDVIDLYQFHNVGSPEQWATLIANGTVDVALEAKRRGLVRHIGASAHTRDAALAVLDHPEIEVVQWPFNFVVAEDNVSVLEKCRARDAGFIAMKPFAGGVVEDASLSVRFLMQYPDVALDPGFERATEIEEVVAICEAARPLDDADRERIRRIRADLGTRFCRRCGYCMPCPEGVEIVTLMNMVSALRRFPPDKILRGGTAAAVASHVSCTDCGQCEDRCPYKLPIREQNKVSVRLYDEFRRTHAA
jgi:predicted aldo/keto reductase-like oxidoreductase